MFSLSVLMSQAANTPAKPPPRPASDDSGLIDLKMLLSEPNEQAPKTDLFSTHVDVFPLGRPPSPSTDAVEISLPAPKPARKAAKAAKIAGAGLLAAALAAAAWGMVTPVQPVMAAERGIMAAAASRVPVIEAEPPPAAPEPPVVAAPEPPKAPAIRQPIIRHNPPVVKTPPVVKQPPPPPVDTTPCDLRCQMERAVKKQTATPRR